MSELTNTGHIDVIVLRNTETYSCQCSDIHNDIMINIYVGFTQSIALTILREYSDFSVLTYIVTVISVC